MEQSCGKSVDVPRKIGLKQKKAIQCIAAECKVVLGVQPTRFIVICNSGIALGLSQDVIIKTFSPFGAIEVVVLLPDKTYCFVGFKDVASARQAYETLHGKALIPHTNNLIVLAFADEAPKQTDMWAALGSEGPTQLKILQDFITIEEEEMLAKVLVWDKPVQGAQLKHRQVQHFGYAFRYGTNDVDSESPLEQGIPHQFSFLQDRLDKQGVFKKNFIPDQLTVNRYLPGQGIPPHVDTHSVFEDPILSLSLLSDVVMDFKNTSGRKIPVLLPRRSLTIMSGESRYGWTHGITPRLHDIIHNDKQGLTVLPRAERISFTFRCLRPIKECSCCYPWLCDSQREKVCSQQLDAVQLEKQYVQEVYEEISDHFSDTRHTPWPNIVDFCKTFTTGQIVVDVGCGNGKYFGQHGEGVSIFEIGIDASAHLAEECSRRGFQVLSGNCLNLPFRSSIADGVLCIAVIHHLATHDRRRQAVQEMARVLCPGGRALIYVWARNQNLQDKMSTYLKQNRKNRTTQGQQASSAFMHSETCVGNAKEFKALSGHSLSNSCDEERGDLPLPVHVNRTNFKHNDVLVPWKLKGRKRQENANQDLQQTFYRYYHVFEADELERMCLEVSHIEVLETKYDQGNWTILLRKLP